MRQQAWQHIVDMPLLIDVGAFLSDAHLVDIQWHNENVSTVRQLCGFIIRWIYLHDKQHSPSIFFPPTNQSSWATTHLPAYKHALSHGKHYQLYLNSLLSPPPHQTSRCTHANKPALSERGRAQNTTRGEWNAGVFVWTRTLQMPMGRYAGSSLQHLVISEPLRSLPPESWANRQSRLKKEEDKRGKKRPRFTRWNISLPFSAFSAVCIHSLFSRSVRLPMLCYPFLFLAAVWPSRLSDLKNIYIL